MRKLMFLSLILCGFLSADVLPYKPKPIIWVHGLGSYSKTWGGGVYWDGKVKTDSLDKDSIVPGSSYDHFLNDFMLPVVEVWDEIDSSYTIPGDASSKEGFYPNKTFLEVINFDYDVGSIDAEGPGGWPPCVAQIGQEAELRQRIKEVLAEHYGPNWQSDTSAKVILVCHSMAATSSRYAITQDPSLASHINKIHQGDTPLKPLLLLQTHICALTKSIPVTADVSCFLYISS